MKKITKSTVEKSIKRSFVFIASVVLLLNSGAATVLAETMPGFDTSTNSYRTYNNIPFTGGGGLGCLPATSTPDGGEISSDAIEVGASIYGGKWDGKNATRDAGDDNGNSATGPLAGRAAIAELSDPKGGQFNAIANLFNLPQDQRDEYGGFKLKSKFRISYKGRTIVVEKADRGGGGGDVQGKTRAVDLWYEAAALLDFREGLGVLKIERVPENTQTTPVGNPVLPVNQSGSSDSSGGATQTNTSNLAQGNKDYKGRQILTDEQMKTIEKHRPIYEKAGQAIGIPWQVLPVLHLRENSLSTNNHSNGQGIYQDYERGGGPYPPGPTTEQEFLRQSEYAAKIFLNKSSNKEALKRGDAEEMKMTMLNYNGRASVYRTQAKSLGFSSWADGSPYVMNKADKLRDPDENPTGWGQIKRDNGPIEYPANQDYGSFVVYAALVGSGLANSDSAECAPAAIGGAVGANGWEVKGVNAMTLYYQIKDPWRNVSYGCGGTTVGSSGCGPTSAAMAITNLKKDGAITPTVVANKFLSNGFRICGQGTSWAPFATGGFLSREYGVTVTSLGTDMTKVAPAIKRGSFVLMSQDGDGGGSGSLFTKGGHYLLIRAITEDGKYLMADPASEEITHNTPNGKRGGLQPISWEGGYTEYEVSGSGTPNYSPGNTKKYHGMLKQLWEISL